MVEVNNTPIDASINITLTYVVTDIQLASNG